MRLNQEEALYKCDWCKKPIMAQDPAIFEMRDKTMHHFCSPESTHCYMNWRDRLCLSGTGTSTPICPLY